MSSRPAIPEDIKREVRKRCGFGCVICGNPIVEYEHIKEYSKVRIHKEDNLTLLCSNHHSQVTKGIISKKIVREYNKKPYNKTKPFTKKLDLFLADDDISFVISTTTFIYENFINGSEFVVLEIFGRKVIYFEKEKGILFFNCIFFNRDGMPIFIVYKNELVFSTNNWDVTIIGRKLVIREGSRKIILEIILGEKIKINKLNINVYGLDIYINKNIVNFGGFGLSNITIMNARKAIVIQ